MSRKRRDLTEEEKALWRRVARGVKTRRPVAEPPPSPDAVKPRAGVQVTKSISVDDGSWRSLRSPGDRVAPKLAPPPADRGAEKRVRRGKLEIDATLDLHGYTQDGGFVALSTFLQNARRRGGRVVLVITGVGRSGEGVLKRRLPEWLAARELKPLISGFAQAHRAHGGAGAYYVFLKRLD